MYVCMYVCMNVCISDDGEDVFSILINVCAGVQGQVPRIHVYYI